MSADHLRHMNKAVGENCISRLGAGCATPDSSILAPVREKIWPLQLQLPTTPMMNLSIRGTAETRLARPETTMFRRA